MKHGKVLKDSFVNGLTMAFLTPAKIDTSLLLVEFNDKLTLDSAVVQFTWTRLPQEGLANYESKSKVRYPEVVLMIQRANDAVLKNVQNQGQNLQNQMANVTSLLTSLCDNFKNSASTSNSGTLPSQHVTNPRQQINAITTGAVKILEETFGLLLRISANLVKFADELAPLIRYHRYWLNSTLKERTYMQLLMKFQHSQGSVSSIISVSCLSNVAYPLRIVSPLKEEIDILLVPDNLIPPGVEDADSEDEVNESPNLTLKEKLKENISSGTLLAFKKPSFLLPPAEPPNECLKNAVLNFYQSKKTFPLNVEDVNSFAFIIWNFLPFFTYNKEFPFIFSFRSENFVFDPGILTIQWQFQ
ncbi:hypothetical protein Tco_1122284 [Tanacetum coccineum]|uniref:Uncharacterized protein n=1 Tax=Tanacetum coccineum TaxID=301880 RepID=A0ABQ5J0C0_9ASTR